MKKFRSSKINVKTPDELKDDLDFEADIRIDLTELDAEWLRQPVLMGRYGRLLADARRNLDRKKFKRDILRAQLAAKVRKNPDLYHIDRISNEAVGNAVEQMPECRDAEQAVNKASYHVEVMEAAVRSMHHRRDALENLVRLHMAEYFAGPTSPRESKAIRARYEDLETKSRLARDRMRAAMRGEQ